VAYYKKLADLDPPAALHACVRDPLGLESRDHVDDWLEVLKYHFPLWAFQAWAYADLQDSKLPTNYPLQLMIRSVVQDDGPKPEEPKFLEPLAFAVDRRRYALADDGRYGRSEAIGRSSLHDPYEQLPLRPGLTPFHRAYPLPVAEDFDPDDPESYNRPHAEIGKELVRLVEARESARGDNEKEKTQKDLDDFLKRMAVPKSSKKFPETAMLKMLKPLVEQGVELFKKCWDVFLDEASVETKRALAAEQVTDPDMQHQWAVRLTLPVFSHREILVLKAQSEEQRAWTPPKGGSYPTPEQLTIWIVARRLRMDARRLARHTLSTQTAYKHFDGPNPIDAIGG